MAKTILFGKSARKELKVGIDTVGNSIDPTIGPKGRNVIFDRGYGGPTITNDGGAISREIVLKDPIQNMGANVTKEVAQKTNDIAGDGRKTSIILMREIVSEGTKAMTFSLTKKFFRWISFKSGRINAIGVKNGIEKASEIAVNYLKSIAKPIKSDEEIAQVATLSSESEEIGKKISETMSKLGVDSVVTVEESPSVGIFSEVSQGMEFEKGFISPYMMTDTKRMEAELKNPLILVTDLKIGAIDEMVPILEQVMKSGKRELVIIAEDVVGEALNTFIINKIQGVITVLGIKSPGFGLRKKDYLEDIATVVGAKFISSEVGSLLSEVTLENLGSADRVVATKDKTIIVGGKGAKEAIDARIEVARAELEKLESKHDQLKVEERIARLSGGVAIIKVGAATEQETKYLKLKTEDAVNSVKAALEEGIVAGGGSALILASKAVLEAKKTGNYTLDELLGFDILAKAMEKPLRSIATNCGFGDGSNVLEKVKNMPNGGGFNALKNEYVENMIEAGIIDPVKVERCAVENAASGGGMFLTTEVAMAEQPKMLPNEMGMGAGG